MCCLFVLQWDLDVLIRISLIEPDTEMLCNHHPSKKLYFASPFLFTRLLKKLDTLKTVLYGLMR